MEGFNGLGENDDRMMSLRTELEDWEKDEAHAVKKLGDDKVFEE